MPPSSLAAKLAAGRLTSAQEAEFRQLVDRMADRLVRLAARIVGSTEQAEDVVQDAWGRVLEALREGRFEGRASIDTWLFRVVVRVGLNARRTRARRGRLSSQPAPSAPSDGTAQPNARVALREVAALLDALPEDQASALVLKELEGLTTAEVARALDCSEGAVEQRLVRARATLREKMS